MITIVLCISSKYNDDIDDDDYASIQKIMELTAAIYRSSNVHNYYSCGSLRRYATLRLRPIHKTDKE